MKKFAKATIAMACMAGSISAFSQAQEVGEVSGYEENVVALLKVGLKAPRIGVASPEPVNPVIQKFIDKFDKHELLLKNVVFRNDHKTIRITWADKSDNYVVKQTYLTSADSILENSRYADKEQAADTKIMYRESKNDAYKYIQVIPMTGSGAGKTTYTDEHPNEERCNFCHILAKSPESPNGVFFRRYQADGMGFNALGKVGNFFDISDFKPYDASAEYGKNLPKMTEPFYYRLAKMDDWAGPKASENTRVMRSLVEIPHLLEVFAFDNQKSICIGIDFGSMANQGFGKSDYICADNKAKMIHVHFTNSLLYGDTKPRVYSEPYIDFKKLPKAN